MDELPRDMLRLLYEQLNGKARLCLSKTTRSLRAVSSCYIKVLATDPDYYQAAQYGDYLSIAHAAKPYHPQILMGAYRAGDLFIITKFKACKTMDYFNAIINATKGGHLFLVEALLASAKQDHSSNTNSYLLAINSALNVVCMTGNIDIFNRLFPIWRRHHITINSCAGKIKLICKYGHEDLLLLIGCYDQRAISYYSLGASGNVDFVGFVRILRFFFGNSLEFGQSDEDWFIEYLSTCGFVSEVVNFYLGAFHNNHHEPIKSMTTLLNRRSQYLQRTIFAVINDGNVEWRHD